MTFVELCKELGIDYRESGQHHHVSRNWVGIDCNTCSPGSKKFKLGYNVLGRYLNCWTCGHKTIAVALAEISKRNVHEIYPLCKSLAGDKVITTLKSVGVYHTPYYERLLNCHGHCNYLENRGFNPYKIAQLWQVGAILATHRVPWRLFIPVRSGYHNVSWTTRAIDPTNLPRYVNARPNEEVYPLKTLLYGEHFVRDTAIVVEGPTDAWRIGPGAVATFGVQVTREQVLRLSKIPTRVILFDREPAAQRAASKLCNLLSCFPGTTWKVDLESGSDPGEANNEEIKELRKRFLGE